MKSIAFLGAKKIGLECFKILLYNRGVANYFIKAVFTNMGRNADVNSKIVALAQEHGIPVYDRIDDILEIDKVDIIVSVQYHEILKGEHIEQSRELAVNLHMAPLPEYRGCNQFSLAIIHGAKVFGTTFHVINEGIDTGDIISEIRFEIPDNCYVDDLYDLTYEKSIELFSNSITDIINGNYKRIAQSELISIRGTMLSYRKDINKLKQIDLSWSKETIEAHIRGTLMPGFEAPYFYIGDRKFSILEST